MENSVRRNVADWSDVFVQIDTLMRSFEEYIKPVLEKHEVENVSISTLAIFLNIGKDGIYIGDLNKKGNYLGSNSSYSLKVLEKNLLIVRRKDSSDKRNIIVEFTKKGQDLFNEIKSKSFDNKLNANKLSDLLRDFGFFCANAVYSKER